MASGAELSTARMGDEGSAYRSVTSDRAAWPAAIARILRGCARGSAAPGRLPGTLRRRGARGRHRGLPNAGKTTLFNALTKAGAEITAYASQTDKSNVGMATIADDRLERLAALVGAKKVTPAAVRVQDVPGTGPALLGGLRQVDALLAVADGFSPGTDPESDIETLKLELLVADTDHVAKRLERQEKVAKSGDPWCARKSRSFGRSSRTSRRACR